MPDPKDILGMSSHLNGDLFLKRLNEEQLAYIREYLSTVILTAYGRTPTEASVDLALEMYARGVDDVGGALVLLAKIKKARENADRN